MNLGFIGTNEIIEIGLNQLLLKKKGEHTLLNFNLDENSTQQPDMLFIDFGSDNQFASERLASLRILYPNVPIMLYISEHNLKTVKQLLNLGIQSVMTYECDFEEIFESMESILKGGKAYCNKVLDVLLNENQDEPNTDCLPVQLSKREIEVLQLVVSGMSSKQIAEELFLSYHTINTHRKNIIKKVGVKNVSELVIFAQNTGLIKIQNT